MSRYKKSLHKHRNVSGNLCLARSHDVPCPRSDARQAYPQVLPCLKPRPVRVHSREASLTQTAALTSQRFRFLLSQPNANTYFVLPHSAIHCTITSVKLRQPAQNVPVYSSIRRRSHHSVTSFVTYLIVGKDLLMARLPQ
jgi:hypothetical protein